MKNINWTEITQEDVVKAIESFLNDTPDYPEPRSTYLVYEGKRLPAKHIRGMAYEVHYGKKISKSEFSGGMETVNFFKRLNFEVEYHGTVVERKCTDTTEMGKTLAKPDAQTTFLKYEKNIDKETVPEKKTVTSDRIIIPSKEVIEQKNALQLILNKLFDGDIVCEKTFDWMKTPEKIAGDYEPVFKALHEYRGDTSFAKKNVMVQIQ